MTENDYQSDLATLVKTVARLESKVETLADTVSTVVQRQNQPRDWIGMGMLAVALATGLASFTILTNGPIKELASSNQAVLRQVTNMLTERSDFMGYTRGQVQRNERDAVHLDDRLTTVEREVQGALARLDASQEVSSRLQDAALRIGPVEGRIQALERIVQDIDAYGSRFWNAEENDP
jgi:hypothetical protein